MSDLQFDADGFVDMEQFPDTDLGAAELDSLRATLLSDPVDEPTDDEWDAMFDDVVGDNDHGPFALDDVDGAVDADDLDATDDDPAADHVAGDDDLDTDGDGIPDVDDLDLDGDGVPDVEDLDLDGDGIPDVDDLDLDLDLDDGGVTDLDLELDAGLDLGDPDDGDDVFSVDVGDDAPADIANNDFEDLL